MVDLGVGVVEYLGTSHRIPVWAASVGRVAENIALVGNRCAEFEFGPRRCGEGIECCEGADDPNSLPRLRF
jgi:hypothetical protein